MKFIFCLQWISCFLLHARISQCGGVQTGQRSICTTIGNTEKWKCWFCVTEEKEPKPRIVRKGRRTPFLGQRPLKKLSGDSATSFSMVGLQAQAAAPAPPAKEELLFDIWGLALACWVSDYTIFATFRVHETCCMLPTQLFCDVPRWCQRAARTCGSIHCIHADLLHKISVIPLVFLLLSQLLLIFVSTLGKA